MKLTIKSFSFANCTAGVLYIDGVPFCKTMELPWLENKSKVSCIPSGTYECEPWVSAKYPSVKDKADGINHVYHIKNVPNREAILIHVGNYTSDVLGCVMVGETFTYDKAKPMIGNSRNTMKKLVDKVGKNNFTIEINRNGLTGEEALKSKI